MNPRQKDEIIMCKIKLLSEYNPQAYYELKREWQRKQIFNILIDTIKFLAVLIGLCMVMGGFVVLMGMPINELKTIALFGLCMVTGLFAIITCMPH